VPVADGTLVARCEACAWSAAPATLPRMALGRGVAAFARALLFLALAAAALALVLAPR